MELLLNLDEHNYDENLDEILRIGIRGIIFKDEKLLMIESSFEELKFPGGGQENGEDDLETLKREILEETGYEIIDSSVKPFGEVIEKRMSVHEEKIWHQINRYYFCEVGNNVGYCNYSDSEKKYGFHSVWVSLDEAIKVNEKMLAKEGKQPWNQREYSVLKMLAKKFEK